MNIRSTFFLAFGLGLFASGCDQSSAPSGSANPTPPVAIPAAQPFEAKPAQVGVGAQGQSLKDEKGIGKAIVQPAMALFRTKEKAVFEFQIPPALELYRAGEGNGEYPPSHDEFMSKIIKANSIQLPRLPAGQVYRYHPDDHQLWVEPESK
jgi:hypothetical protein